MSRYIAVNALKQQIESPYTEYPVMIQIRKALKNFIDSAPSIDIVFCRECKYKDMELCAMYKLVVAGVRKYNDFCSYGEREDE